MSQQQDPIQFKQQVAEFFNDRTRYDEESDFHPRLAQRLVEYAQLQPGQKVLDVCTGTGLAAIAAAQAVAPHGWVVGVDLAEGMLRQAKRKLEALQLFNVSLYLTDAETLYFPENCFDVILCSSALVYLTNIPASLQLWHSFLKPGGLLGLHGFSADSFISSVVMQKVARNYGVSLVFNQPTGTEAQCRSLLQTAGFEDITIHAEQFGSYISLEAAKQMWNPDSRNPMLYPLRQLPPAQLEQAKQDYFTELESLQSDRGLWNNICTFFAIARKSGNSS